MLTGTERHTSETHRCTRRQIGLKVAIRLAMAEAGRDPNDAFDRLEFCNGLCDAQYWDVVREDGDNDGRASNASSDSYAWAVGESLYGHTAPD